MWRWQLGGGEQRGGRSVEAEQWRRRQHGDGGIRAAMVVTAGRQHGGGIGRVAEAAHRRRQRGGSGGSTAAAARRRHWQCSGGVGNMVAASAEAAQQQHGRSNQHGVSGVSGVAVWTEWCGNGGQRNRCKQHNSSVAKATSTEMASAARC
jgi:hypothetical protein